MEDTINSLLIYIFILLPFIIISLMYIFTKNVKWFVKYPMILVCGWFGFRAQIFLMHSYIGYENEVLNKYLNFEILYVNLASWIPTLIFLFILQALNKFFNLFNKIGKAPFIDRKAMLGQHG